MLFNGFSPTKSRIENNDAFNTTTSKLLVDGLSIDKNNFKKILRKKNHTRLIPLFLTMNRRQEVSKIQILKVFLLFF